MKHKITMEQKLLWAEKYRLFDYLYQPDTMLIYVLRSRRKAARDVNFYEYLRGIYIMFGPRHKLP